MRKMIVIWLRRKTRAFTLIELLVVIAIIGILAAMLLPVLSKAREKGNAAKCISNMHQWALAMNMYNDDWDDKYPYVGDASDPCGVDDASAWYNVLPPYIGQKTLCQLYTLKTPPTPRQGSIWICMSATNKGVNPDPGHPYFCYSLSDGTHSRLACTASKATLNIFKRSRMVKPSTTIVFCEEAEDNYSETSGAYAFITRHSGGANFAMGDGHVEWLQPFQVCREGGTTACPDPFLNSVPWTDSSFSGDWSQKVIYHWWFAEGMSEGCY